jgi:hypothetical protein
VSRIVSERRFLLIRKYLDGARRISGCVFPLAIPTLSRHSQRLREKNNRQGLLLAVFSNQQNKVKDVLDAAQMRLMWNPLNEEMIGLPFMIFKKNICKNEFYEYLCACGPEWNPILIGYQERVYEIETVSERLHEPGTVLRKNTQSSNLKFCHLKIFLCTTECIHKQTSAIKEKLSHFKISNNFIEVN